MNRIRVAAAAALLATGALGSVGAAGISKPEYEAAVKNAETTFKADRARCDRLAGNAQDVCMANARLGEARARARAETDYRPTAKAAYHARKQIAEAEYDVARARCGALSGNAKDVCVKEAKAVETRAKSDAEARYKANEAYSDAASEQRDAAYKLALERCDGFSGDAKDLCVRDAKAARDRR